MGGQDIVQRIISDAEKEAENIISDAESKAAKTVAEASARAERIKTGNAAEVAERAKSIADGKAATARLDGAKIFLGEKRGVIDEVYARALKKLNELKEGDAVYLANRLLNQFAEEGDEIVFAENFRYAQKVAALDVVKEKGLKVSSKRAELDGGFVLSGKICDKDVSYGALLAADREQKQAQIATEIFNN